MAQKSGYQVATELQYSGNRRAIELQWSGVKVAEEWPKSSTSIVALGIQRGPPEGGTSSHKEPRGAKRSHREGRDTRSYEDSTSWAPLSPQVAAPLSPPGHPRFLPGLGGLFDTS